MRKMEALQQIKVMTKLLFFLHFPLSFADYANLISPSTRSQWGGGGGESPTRDQKTYRTIAESYATPRPRAAAFSAAGLERAGRDLGRQILLLSERARASSSFLDSWTEFDI